jgi:hypothetical protein
MFGTFDPSSSHELVDVDVQQARSDFIEIRVSPVDQASGRTLNIVPRWIA